ncbi:J domain-containing protein [Sulfurimonas sp. MAG313]|nr:J domain-containing protein [Sulfurimonas sp. MAG313]MDF1881040.1 J domain-containing protein [Sulfurimonas sp. MAG313]
MSSTETLLKAKTLLGLYDKATLFDIKQKYRNLMHKWHPDKNPDNLETAQQMSIKINEAYKTVLEYTKNYEYTFKEEDIKDKYASPHDWWESRFGDVNRPKE